MTTNLNTGRSHNRAEIRRDLTFLDIFSTAVKKNPDGEFLAWATPQKKGNAKLGSISYLQVAKRAWRFANYLQDLGLEPGDRVASISDNCVELFVVFIGTLYAGGIPVPVYPFEWTPAAIQTQIADADVRFVFYENDAQKKRLGKKPPACIEVLQHFDAVQIAIAGSSQEKYSLFLELPEERQKAVAPTVDPESKSPDFRAYKPFKLYLDSPPAVSVDPSDVMFILYTSGSSGTPKGVVHTHQSALCVPQFFEGVGIFRDKDRVSSVLPIPHILPMGVMFIAVAQQLTLVITSEKPSQRARLNPLGIKAGISEGQCHVLIMVPKLLKPMIAEIKKQIAQNMALQFIEECALAAYRSEKTSYLSRAQQEAPKGFIAFDPKDSWKATLGPLARTILKYLVTRKFGPNARIIASGGAELPYYVGEYIEAVLGLQCLQGYGSTEWNVTHAQLPDGVLEGYVRVQGNIGVPLHPSIKQAWHRELGMLVDTYSAMQEYHNKAEATKDMFVQHEGKQWCCTEDATHQIDRFGSVVFEERKSSEYKNDGGQKVQPGQPEGLIQECTEIGYAVVFGKDKPRNIAVISLDKEAATQWAEAHGLRYEELPGNAQFKEYLLSWIKAEVNGSKDTPKLHHVSDIFIAPEPFSAENELLTGKGSVRRKFVIERYQSEIEALYA